MKTSVWLFPCLALFVFFSCNPGGKQTASKAFDEGKECIRRVMAADDSLGKIRNLACKEFSLSESIDTYVKAVKAVNGQNCPAAFNKAFANHMNAWLEIKTITDFYPSLRGEMHALFAQLENGKDSAVFRKLHQSVWNTWAVVEKAMKE